jgi:hypothetical protein
MLPSSNPERTMLHEWHQLKLVSNSSGKCSDGETGNCRGIEVLLHESARRSNSCREHCKLHRDIRFEGLFTVEVAQPDQLSRILQRQDTSTALCSSLLRISWESECPP